MAFGKKKQKRSCIYLTSASEFEDLCASEYIPLDHNPEVMSACRRIADVISSMTIHLMANTESGDQRIVNELSRRVDIYPTPNMTRKTWMDAIVMNLLLYGRGNSVVLPVTRDGLLEKLVPIAADRVTFLQNGRDSYKIAIDNITHDPADVLHFVYNPDKRYMWKGAGFQTSLKAVADTLNQAAKTKKGFMSSKWKPSVIVKVDALVDEFASKEGRQRLLKDYLETSEAGEPWMIPAEQFSIEQVRPLSLADLAITDSVKLDKQTVASILGVPPFALGIGNFNAAEWNAFVSNTIRPIAREIEQEMTRKLLISPKMYWRFNIASIYAYDIKETADVYSNLYVRGIVTGNEVRDKLSLEPLKGLDELVLLENYIPLDKIGDQKKLQSDGN